MSDPWISIGYAGEFPIRTFLRIVEQVTYLHPDAVADISEDGLKFYLRSSANKAAAPKPVSVTVEPVVPAMLVPPAPQAPIEDPHRSASGLQSLESPYASDRRQATTFVTLSCPWCGKDGYGSAAGLSGHKRWCGKNPSKSVPRDISRGTDGPDRTGPAPEAPPDQQAETPDLMQAPWACSCGSEFVRHEDLVQHRADARRVGRGIEHQTARAPKQVEFGR